MKHLFKLQFSSEICYHILSPEGFLWWMSVAGLTAYRCSSCSCCKVCPDRGWHHRYHLQLLGPGRIWIWALVQCQHTGPPSPWTEWSPGVNQTKLHWKELSSWKRAETLHTILLNANENGYLLWVKDLEMNSDGQKCHTSAVRPALPDMDHHKTHAHWHPWTRGKGPGCGPSRESLCFGGSRYRSRLDLEPYLLHTHNILWWGWVRISGWGFFTTNCTFLRNYLSLQAGQSLIPRAVKHWTLLFLQASLV